MAFPDSDLPLQFEAAFGADPEASPGSWTFTSLTSRFLDSVVNLRVGKRAGSKTADPSAVAALFNNHDGDLTPMRALSTYWPNIKLDTPFRTKLRRADDTFTRTTSNGWGTSDSLHAWTTAGGAAADYSTSGSAGSVVVSAGASDRITVVDVAGRHQDVRILATTNGTPTGASIDTGVVARYTSASNFYAGMANVSTAGIVTAKIVKCVAGSLSTVTSVSTGLSTATSKHIRFRVIEDRLQLKIWLLGADEPDDWDLDVIDTSLTTGNLAGSYSRRTNAFSSITTFTYDDFDTTHVLFEGFTDSWKPDFIPSTAGGTSVTRVTASGPLRRLGQGSKPLRSAPYMAITGAATPPVAWWPLALGKLQNISPPEIPAGGPAMEGVLDPLFNNILPNWEQGDLAPWLPPGADLTGEGTARATVPPMPAGWVNTSGWTADITINVGSQRTPSTSPEPMLYVTGGGPYPTVDWDIEVQPAGGVDPSVSQDTVHLIFLEVNADVSSTATVIASASHVLFDNQPHQLRLTVAQSGANIAWTLSADGVLLASGTVNTKTLQRPARVELNPIRGNQFAKYAMGDVVIWGSSSPPEIASAALGYAGEEAQTRLARLCDQVGVPFLGMTSYATAPMGPQLLDTFMANVLDCETTDQGVLGEGNFGLTYIPRMARYRRPVGATINLATYRTTKGTSNQVLSPTFDDQAFRNEWTVTRPDGTSVTGADFSRVALPYGDSATPNPETVEQLVDDFSWRLALSSAESMRWPNTPVDLAANPDMVGEWLGLTPGLSRIVRTGLPSRGPDGDIDELLDGTEHTIRRRAWTINYAASPAKVYNEIGVWGSNAAGTRFGARNTVLAEDLTAVETGADVTATGEVWITTASHPTRFPFDVTIGGLVYSCTAITGTTPNYTLTLVRLASDKTHATGAPVTVTDTGRYGL